MFYRTQILSIALLLFSNLLKTSDSLESQAKSYKDEAYQLLGHYQQELTKNQNKNQICPCHLHNAIDVFLSAADKYKDLYNQSQTDIYLGETNECLTMAETNLDLIEDQETKNKFQRILDTIKSEIKKKKE